MIVEFAEDVLADPTAFDPIDKIMRLILEGRHYLWMELILEQTAWFRSLSERHRETYKDIARRSYNLPLDRSFDRVKVTRQAVSRALRPEIAYKYLSEDLTVVLENVESDGAFMRLVLAKFSPNRLLRSYNEGWLRFQAAGGGGSIWGCVEEIQKHQVDTALLRESDLPGRLLIFRDSDAMYPGHVKKDVEISISRSIALGVSFFCTQKREMENYLPIKILRYEFADTKPDLMNAFESLKQEQRDHFDMKNGYPQGVPNEQVALFAGVTPDVMRHLSLGFHQRVWALFSKYFESVSKRDFDSSASLELSRLVKTMEKLC